MIIIAVRHLPTAKNEAKILQGRSDDPIAPISHENRILIQENLKFIEKNRPNIILTSPLLRTQQTAVAYGFTEFSVEPLSIELDFGPLQDMRRQAAIDLYKNDWIDNFDRVHLGEPFAEFISRVESFIRKYENQNSILLFGHGAFIRALCAITTEIPAQKMNKIKIMNNEIAKISTP